MSSKARFPFLARGLKQRDTKAGCPLAGVRIARSIANQRIVRREAALHLTRA